MITFLAVTMDQMPDTFFNAANLAQFWFYVKWTLIWLMPLIMICLAVLVADQVLDMILGVFGRTTKEQEQDYEIEEY